MAKDFSFKIKNRLDGSLARTGVINTPHGSMQTPGFTVVGTKATVKSLTPEQIKTTKAEAVLVNAYHLYLQPGPDLIDELGGVGAFMNWDGPTFSDSGGFQVLSLGVGFKKVLALDTNSVSYDMAVSKNGERLAHVDNDGVTFKSHINGSLHRFTPEVSMQVQHKIGADIMFAFDECTSIMQSYLYQQDALERTHKWALRCLAEHQSLTQSRKNKPYQALFGVLQGANYQDLREETARFMAGQPFDGYGIGGALEKPILGQIIQWVNAILPEDRPRHLLGISEFDDVFIGIENGVDTFDCVSPARVARNGALFTEDGRINITNAKYKTDGSKVIEDCLCYTCTNFSKAYLRHLFKANERLAASLATIHNETFIIGLMANIRESINDGTFLEYKKDWLKRYYGNSRSKVLQ